MDPTYVIITVEGTEIEIPEERGHWHELMSSGFPLVDLQGRATDRMQIEDWVWAASASSQWKHREPLFARQTTIDTALQDLMDLTALQNDWDGMGAIVPTNDILGRALRLLKSLDTVPPEVSAHPAGTVLFEWESDAGWAYIEIGRTVFNFYMTTKFHAPYAEVGDVNSLEVGTGTCVPAVLLRLQSNREFLAPDQMIGITHVEW